MSTSPALRSAKAAPRRTGHPLEDSSRQPVVRSYGRKGWATRPSTPVASRLLGGWDEFFTRADGGGAYTPITDALGSVVALVDSSGAVQTQYSYDPFGSTTAVGLSNGNVFQYTGRENDGNGLYYYRARYYSPLLGRFISEDPIGLGGGINYYTYVNDSPVNFRDPLGNRALPVEIPTQPSIPGFPWFPQDPEVFNPDGTPVRMPGLIEQFTWLCQAYGWGWCSPEPVLDPAPVRLPATMAGRNCKSNRFDECMDRFLNEKAFCERYYGTVLYSMCRDRAAWRHSNCQKGLPDPGPLDPLDPNWSID